MPAINFTAAQVKNNIDILHNWINKQIRNKIEEVYIKGQDYFIISLKTYGEVSSELFNKLYDVLTKSGWDVGDVFIDGVGRCLKLTPLNESVDSYGIHLTGKTIIEQWQQAPNQLYFDELMDNIAFQNLQYTLKGQGTRNRKYEYHAALQGGFKVTLKNKGVLVATYEEADEMTISLF